MAKLIPFPGTKLPTMPAPVRAPVPKPKLESGGATVTRIGRGRSIPKANRPEDRQTIAFARMAANFEDQAYALAQTEPNSENHRTALHMAQLSDQLPRNNLRIFTTPEDVVQGLWKAERRVAIANAEWVLADLQRSNAADDMDEDAGKYWAAEREKAEAKLWLEYERLARIPATSLSQFDQLKRVKVRYGVVSLEWLRTHKPDLAAILDDELARLNAEKAERAAARAAKKGAG